VNNFEGNLFGFDLFQRAGERFKRTLRIAFQHDPKNLLASGCFKQAFQRSPLRNEQLAGAFCLQPFIT
jgi:hypothetical protein